MIPKGIHVDQPAVSTVPDLQDHALCSVDQLDQYTARLLAEKISTENGRFQLPSSKLRSSSSVTCLYLWTVVLEGSF